ncbi:MAG TPA: DUF4446 family protein [Solirubrobacteraceae bacterium]
MDDLTSTTGLVALGASAVALTALVVAVVSTVRLRRLRADQVALLGGGAPTDLVAHSAELQRGYEALHAYVEDVARRLDARLGTAEARLDEAIAYHGLVRYDAYNEMSGHQSTSIALLDASRSGIVLSSIHHRDQARLYAKQVRDGQAELQLSPEEQEAIRVATSGEPPPPLA